MASYSNALEFAYNALEKFEGERPEEEENVSIVDVMQIRHKLNVNDANYSAESITKKVGKSKERT